MLKLSAIVLMFINVLIRSASVLPGDVNTGVAEFKDSVSGGSVVCQVVNLKDLETNHVNCYVELENPGDYYADETAWQFMAETARRLGRFKRNTEISIIMNTGAEINCWLDTDKGNAKGCEYYTDVDFD